MSIAARKRLDLHQGGCGLVGSISERQRQELYYAQGATCHRAPYPGRDHGMVADPFSPASLFSASMTTLPLPAATSAAPTPTDGLNDILRWSRPARVPKTENQGDRRRKLDDHALSRRVEAEPLHARHALHRPSVHQASLLQGSHALAGKDYSQ